MPISRLHRSDFGSWTRDRQANHVFNTDNGGTHVTRALYEASSASTRQLLHVTLHSMMDNPDYDDEDEGEEIVPAIQPPTPRNIPARNQGAARPPLREPPPPDIVLPHLANAVASLSIAYVETGDQRIRGLRTTLENLIRARRQGT